MGKFWDKVLEIIGMILGAALGLGIPIWIIIDIVSGDSLVLRCLSAIWNGIGSVVMFFVGIFAKIAGFFSFI